jgi:hypothetical protein
LVCFVVLFVGPVLPREVIWQHQHTSHKGSKVTDC